MRGWKIAYCRDFGGTPADPEVLAVVDAAVRALEDAGARIDAISVPMPADRIELSELWCRLIAVRNLATVEEFKAQGFDLLKDHRNDLPTPFLERLDAAVRVSALEIARDQALRSKVLDAVQNTLDTYRLLITPTTGCSAIANPSNLNVTGPSAVNGVAVNPIVGWAFTHLLNLTGHPAASIPAGLDRHNLPVGMQMIANRLHDSDVLTAAAVLERIRPWRDFYRHCEQRSLDKPAPVRRA